MCRYFIEQNFSSIQITLDDDKNTHDKLRIYKNDRGSYEDVYRTLKMYSYKLPIVLNINLNSINKDSVSCILGHLGFSLVFDHAKQRYQHTLF